MKSREQSTEKLEGAGKRLRISSINAHYTHACMNAYNVINLIYTCLSERYELIKERAVSVILNDVSRPDRTVE